MIQFAYLVLLKKSTAKQEGGNCMKYKDWLEEWLDDYVLPVAKRRTYLSYAAMARQHLAAELGKYELPDLTLGVLQRYVNSLLKNGNLKTGKGLAANTVNLIVNVIQNSLRVAYEAGLVENDVATNLKRPKLQEKAVSCFTEAEQTRLEKYLLAKQKPRMFGVILCLYTGLRIGELLALEWKDIDCKRGLITINKACYHCKENGVFMRVLDTPKTETSARVVPLPRQLIPYVKQLKQTSNSLYVVAGREGNPVSVRSYQRSFEQLLKRLKLPKRGFHSLRHTFATRALECGMDVKTLSEILGHKNANITLSRYVHSLMNHKCEMMNKVGRRIG
jgi:integrase